MTTHSAISPPCGTAHAQCSTLKLPRPATHLPAALLHFIDEWRNKPGNLIMVLHRVQEHYGYIPRESAFELADLLDVPVAKIYGVITFYHLFKLTKPGRNRIAICMGTACYLKGGEDILLELERLLGVGLNTVTADGEFSIEAVRCIGCCGLAPVMSINGEVFGCVKKAKLPKILATFRGKS
jgi:NADH-quinone oxidoreductase subunit E